jgi:hypothetical protein
MTVPKIESGVSVPAGAGKHGRHPIRRETFAKMLVGDSFTVPYSNSGKFFQAAQSLGMRCATRREGENLRVWRIA